MDSKNVIFAAACLACAMNLSAAESRTRDLLNFDWKFHPGDAPGAEAAAFDDSSWRTVDLPHDFSVEGPFDKGVEFGGAVGFRPRGIGWYRKVFASPPDGSRVFLDFEGIHTDSKIWLNGELLGENHHGYLGFRFDVTDRLAPAGEPNTLAVRADNTRLRSSRWYNGGGIYRNVRLVTLPPVHVAWDGIWISTPEITDDRATARVEVEVSNTGEAAADVEVTTEILDPDGRPVTSGREAGRVPAGETVTFRRDFEIPSPQRWDTGSPHLYRAVTRVENGGTPDEVSTAFGIRSVEFSPEKGLLLNGRKVLVKGVNIHHDLGCLGASAFDRGHERRLEILKSMGCNAIRLAHNPYHPSLLEQCDRMGILVFAEAYDKWTDQFTGPARPFAEAWREDLTAFIRRDRNHPSVIVWSVGNEVLPHQITAPDYGVEQYREMAALVKGLDPTRAVTCGLYPARAGGVKMGSKPPSLYRESAAPPLALETDIACYNYMQDFFERDRAAHPHLIFVASEIGTNGSGEQFFDYDHTAAVGQFYWGGFDYIGESFGWPVKGWFRGFLDLAGFRKPAAHYVESIYSDKPMVHVTVRDPRPGDNVVWNDARLNWEYLSSHWNWTAGETVEIFTFSNADTVELFLNGRSIGIKQMADHPKRKMAWKVPFEPGELKAVATRDGKVVAEHQLTTAGKAARLLLENDRPVLKADGLDLAHVTVRVTDANGVTVPDAAHKIRFSVTGSGKIAGVDNGNMYSDELWQAEERSAYNGNALLVVRADQNPGTALVKASADGLEPASLEINVQ